MLYLFELGSQNIISTEEIKNVLDKQQTDYTIKIKQDKNLIVETKQKLDAEKFINTLGGTVKIAQELPLAGSIENTIIVYLLQNQSGKIQFSINGNKKAFILAKKIKKELKDEGRSCRFVQAETGASLLHNKLIEKQGDFIISDGKVFVSLALQPFPEFVKRDMERPKRDIKSGILPPKLARIMLNLTTKKPEDCVFLDPFCGSGTILNEAILLGFKKVIGNDAEKKAVNDSKDNTKWLLEEYKLNTPVELLCGKVENLEKVMKNNSVDFVATEPYMGKPLRGKESLHDLKSQAEELKKLYVDAFQNLSKVIKKDGEIIFIFPNFKYKNEWIRTEDIKEITKKGFELKPFSENESLFYYREGQFLARVIYRFVKT